MTIEVSNGHKWEKMLYNKSVGAQWQSQTFGYLHSKELSPHTKSATLSYLESASSQQPLSSQMVHEPEDI